ncbi:MAG: hypothetical protein F6J92_42060, partial [Symploca sp. SIO1A3]|nr:hypothetical protein [Symploca sp. SIO1A3]
IPRLLKATNLIVGLSSPGIIPVSIIVSENIHRKANQKVLSLEKALGDARASLKQLENVQDDNGRLSIGIAELKTELSRVENSLSSLKTENCNLKESLQFTQAQLAVSSSQQAKLSEQVIEYEESYSNELESEVQQKVQKYITQDREALKSKYRALLEEGEAIYAEAMLISEKYKAWAGEVAKRHQDRKAYIMGVTGEFNKRIGEAQEAWEVERGHLLTQIEALNEKVARLQQQLAGDLVEPELLSCRFAIPGQIANELAKIIWKGFTIPLAAKGAQQRSNGLIEIGYAYSRSQAPSELVAILNRNSDSLASELGVHKITSVREHDLTPTIIVGLRREPGVKEDEIQRLLTPVDKLAKIVLRELEQKPTIRIMGSTGEGKGICAKYLLSVLSSYSQCYIRIHDPQHGSPEDHWDIPKVSKNGAEVKQALKSIVIQMSEREVSKNCLPVTVDVLDEIDTQLTNEEKSEFQGIISRIRHLGMRVILIGQNPKVAKVKFEWSDMDQMIGFYQKSAALTAIEKHPGLKFKKDMLTKQYHQLAEAYEIKNQDLDTHKQYYFGLCVMPNKKPIWYELPVADEVEINEQMSVIGETFRVSVSNSLNVKHTNQVFQSTNQHYYQQPPATDESLKPLSDNAIAQSVASTIADPMGVCCPKCGSSTKRNGKNPKGIQKYLCKDRACRYSFKA